MTAPVLHPALAPLALPGLPLVPVLPGRVSLVGCTHLRGRGADRHPCGRAPALLRGPRTLGGEEGAYRWEDGPPLCERCSRVVWRAYKRRVRERVALRLASREVGYPMTTTQFRAWKVAQDRPGHQLPLWRTP